MKKLIYILLLFLFLMSCNSEPSLQKYMAKNTENSNFIALDLGADILGIAKENLTSEEKEMLNSFQKLNVLVFRSTPENQDTYVTEKDEVKKILKENSKYEELMRFGSGADAAAVYVVGKDDRFNEFVLFGNKKDTGFIIARILGKNMNPTQIMTFMSLLEKSNINQEQLKPLEGFFTKDSETDTLHLDTESVEVSEQETE